MATVPGSSAIQPNLTALASFENIIGPAKVEMYKTRLEEGYNVNDELYSVWLEMKKLTSTQIQVSAVAEQGIERERERKGLYVQSTQIGYIRTSEAWKKEK